MKFASSFLAVSATLAALTVSTLGSASIALAQSTDLGDLVGARAGQSERELQRRGYRNVGSERGDDRSYTFWWNAERRQCVTIATMDGRFSSITPTPAADCGRSASNERQRDRGYRDRPRRDYESSRQSSRGSDVEDMKQYCREEAADRVDRRVSEMYIMSAQKLRTQSIVYGYHQPRGTNVFYYCYFDTEGRLTEFQGG